MVPAAPFNGTNVWPPTVNNNTRVNSNKLTGPLNKMSLWQTRLVAFGLSSCNVAPKRSAAEEIATRNSQGYFLAFVNCHDESCSFQHFCVSYSPSFVRLSFSDLFITAPFVVSSRDIRADASRLSFVSAMQARRRWPGIGR